MDIARILSLEVLCSTYGTLRYPAMPDYQRWYVFGINFYLENRYLQRSDFLITIVDLLKNIFRQFLDEYSDGFSMISSTCICSITYLMKY